VWKQLRTRENLSATLAWSGRISETWNAGERVAMG
jgi:hypothetical protein